MTGKFKIAFLLLLLSGCKYEDGPFLSFISIPNRVPGKYHIDNVFVNGDDVTSQTDALNIDYFYFDGNDEYVGGDGQFQVFFKDTTSPKHSYWAFSEIDDREKISLPPFGCFFYGGNGVPVDFEPLPGFVSDGSCTPLLWDIQKLSNYKMWLSITFNNITYEVRLTNFSPNL